MRWPAMMSSGETWHLTDERADNEEVTLRLREDLPAGEVLP